MPNFRKRFDKTSRKRFQNSDNQSRIHIPNVASDVVEAKRMRFKDPETGGDLLRRSRDEGGSARGEAREAPLGRPVGDVGDSKTSEFAYFKKLKKGVGRTSCTNLVGRESTEVRNFGQAKDYRELGVPKNFQDVRAPMYSKKSSATEIGSLLRPEDVAIQCSGTLSQVNDESMKSSSLIKTPTTIDFYDTLSASATASASPKIQLKNGDIFSAKRQKLKQWIAKTLFPEADKLPKECDVVSLLLSRLLPESAANNPSKSRNLRQSELEDKCQELPGKSSAESEESWGGTQKLVHKDLYSGDGIYDAYRDTRPGQSTRCSECMVLGFTDGNAHGSSLNDNYSGRMSEICGEGNLLTWTAENCDYSLKSRTSSNFLEGEVRNQLINCFGTDRSYRFSGHSQSYELPTVHYDLSAETYPRRSCPEYKDEPTHCKWDRRALDSWLPISIERLGPSPVGELMDSAELNEFAEDCRSCPEYTYDRYGSKLDRRAPDTWYPVTFERFGPSALSNIRDSAELNKFEMSGEPSPLLLPWSTESTDDANREALTHSTDMDHDVNPSSWSKDDRSLGSSASLSIYPSILPDIPMLYSSSNILQNHHTQRHHRLQQKDTVVRPTSAQFTLLYGPDPLSPDADAGVFKDMFRGNRFFVIPEDHNRNVGNMVSESIFPGVGALLISQALDSDLGLESKSLSECIEQQYDIPTVDADPLLRLEKPSSQLLYKQETSLEMPDPEEWSLVNVNNPALQLNRIRWLDTAVEAHYDGCVNV